MAADFTIFGVFGFVGLFASVLLLRWMRTAILAGGIAVVRSGSCSVCGLPKMVNGYVFCSTATGLLGRTALGAKKKILLALHGIKRGRVRKPHSKIA